MVPGLGRTSVTKLTPADPLFYRQLSRKHGATTRSVLTGNDQKGARDRQAGADPESPLGLDLAQPGDRHIAPARCDGADSADARGAINP